MVDPDATGPESTGGPSAHAAAIERAVQLMHQRIHEPISLGQLASAAHLSPFYFSRLFRHMTGSPPGEFLAALRLDAAKRLLMTTPMSVTEICYEVGYTSLGSFSTRFTRAVGLAPAELRRLSAEPSPSKVAALARGAQRVTRGTTVSGRVSAPQGIDGPISVGVFTRPIPQGPPIVCTLLSEPGAFHVGPLAPGRYYLLAASLPWSDDPQLYLMPRRGLLVGVARGPIEVSPRGWRGPAELSLHPPRALDPPIVVALPLLQARYQLG